MKKQKVYPKDCIFFNWEKRGRPVRPWCDYKGRIFTFIDGKRDPECWGCTGKEL